MILYRPVGKKELELIKSLESKAFPARLPDQPIFYPVLNAEYAREIASKWNTKDAVSGYCGFVTQFEINDNYIQRFEIKTVGSTIHQEYWIPSAELEDFNKNIIGTIKVIESYYGEGYKENGV